MAAVLQFRRRSAPQGWANEELAQFYRIVDVMALAGLRVSVDVGLSDEGEPWAVFVRDDSHDVLVHIARIDGWIVAVSAASRDAIRALTLTEVVKRIVEAHPLVLLPAHRPGSQIHIHPCAVLAAVVAAAYLLAEGVQSEARAREIELADIDFEALAVGGAHTPVTKAAPHPNALRSALTSLTDYLRGVGDLAQPIPLSVVSVNAAIAAVVAFMFSGEETGASNEQLIASNEAIVEAIVIASLDEGRLEAGGQTSTPQHVLGLDVSLSGSDVSEDSASGGERALLSQTLTMQSKVENLTTPKDPSPGSASDLSGPPQINKSEASTQVMNDLAVVYPALSSLEVFGSAELVVKRPSRSAASESISTAPETVADASDGVVKAELQAATAAVIASGAAADAGTSPTSMNAASVAEVTVFSWSEISKHALAALGISAPFVSVVDLAKASSATNGMSNASSAEDMALSSVERVADASDLGSVTSEVSSSLVARMQTTNSSELDAASGATTTRATTSSSAAASSMTSQTADNPSSSVPSPYDIIGGILTFAYQDTSSVRLSDVAKGRIDNLLTTNGYASAGQRVLLFSSDVVAVPIIQLSDRVVLLDYENFLLGDELGQPIGHTIAARDIDLPEGGSISLLGVVSFGTLT
jgi:hypothetical protein